MSENSDARAAHAAITNLSSDDQDAIQRVVSSQMGPRGHPFPGRKMPTIDGMMGRWRWAVEKLERGYRGGVDDYIHDLDGRDHLQEVVDALGGKPRDAVSAALSEIDARFLRITYEDPTRILERVTRPGTGWWWSRLPCQPGSNLEATLRPFR